MTDDFKEKPMISKAMLLMFFVFQTAAIITVIHVLGPTAKSLLVAALITMSISSLLSYVFEEADLNKYYVGWCMGLCASLIILSYYYSQLGGLLEIVSKIEENFSSTDGTTMGICVEINAVD